jgi:acetyl esterase/lipase
MASRITLDATNQPADGGLYRRVDGPNPSWQLVYRWPVDTAILQSRYLRGLTAVPDPAGSGRECLIAAFEYPGTIVRFAPTADGASVTATQELDIKEYFNQAWDTPGVRRRGAIAAYNRFLPVTDPASGDTVWMCGAWVERQGSPDPPDNGSCYLIRHRDGRYEWGYIDDPAHPVPAGQRLTGCRDIEPSPFPGEAGRVFYFCGYDGGAGPSHNTAWIYRGDTTDEEATHEEQASTLTPAGPRSPLDSTGGGMESYQGIRYRELPDVDPNLLSLDVYAPKGAQNLPVLFWIHGGGLTGGSKFVGRGLPQFCSRVGMVLVSMNYRLSPAVKHPAHVEDCAAAFTWTHDHIHEYGGDPNRMFVSGHSSGAQLAGLLSADARRLADVGLGLANITGAILFDSAAYDMTTRRATDDSIYAKAFGTDPEVLRDGSPLLHVAPGHNTPPHLLVGAKAPGQTAEAKLQKLEAVAARYRAAGVRCEVVGAFFRQHNTVISEFGPAEEPVTVEVTKFIQSILNAEPVDPALGQAKVLELPGRSAEEVERENDISSARTLVKILDTDTDGRVSRAEAEARGQSWLRWFPSLDKDQDGFITVEEQR